MPSLLSKQAPAAVMPGVTPRVRVIVGRENREVLDQRRFGAARGDRVGRKRVTSVGNPGSGDSVGLVATPCGPPQRRTTRAPGCRGPVVATAGAHESMAGRRRAGPRSVML